MAERFYKASLSRTQGRNTFAIIFRHPKRSDPATGRDGLRVRQSLKTDDAAEAETLLVEMNALLASPDLWTLSAREQALATFDARIVEIFYYKLEAEEVDFAVIRDYSIELPSAKSSDYRRVLFLGTTGAGKTTLLRQVIGTDPLLERFPSTSTAKTTVHDTEVVLDDGPYRAVVTFYPMEEVREHLKECVSAATLAAYRKEPSAEIMRKLLAHVNQRFRFSYLLGNGPIKEANDFDDDEAEEDEDLSKAAIDLTETNLVLSRALDAVITIAKKNGDALRAELDASDEKDQRVVDELFEEELDNRTRDDESFQEVVDALLDEIELRFNQLRGAGKTNKTKVGWPLSWEWETDDREVFIKTIAKFSSNYAPLFGSLLTPLVNGVRVAGPFKPTWTSSQPKLVLLDGEGLGHTPKSVSTISTSLTRRIDSVDAIVLVDNAEQPMQAAPVAAIKEVVSSGGAAKLVFAFTHFDRVSGDNLPTSAARVHHVLASAENVLASIGEELGPFAERALRARLETSRVFLSNVDRTLNPTVKEDATSIKQFKKLLQILDEIVERPKPSDSRPIYDRMNLALAIERAAAGYHELWLPKLGQKMKAGQEKEHWTRIKALSRRLATNLSDEYDSLKPVADLKKQLQDRLYVLLQNPLEWDGPVPCDDDKQHIYDAIAEELSRTLIELSSRRVRADRMPEWRKAFVEQGSGSTFRRAKIIANEVYDKAVPIPDVAPGPDRNAFLSEVAAIIKHAVEAVGGQLR
jgi:hypothetical protein